MKPICRVKRGLRTLFLGILGLSSFSHAGELEVSDAWINAGPPNAMALAGYMTISNTSDVDVNVSAVSSDHFSTIEMHRTQIRDGIARMRQQRVLLIPAKGQLILEPQSLHLMLMGPKSPLKIGDQIELTLELDSGKKVNLQTTVKQSQLE